MIDDIIRERKVRDHLENLDMADLVEERIESEDRIESLEVENKRLREALKDISREGQWANNGGTAYNMLMIARTALKEVER